MRLRGAPTFQVAGVGDTSAVARAVEIEERIVGQPDVLGVETVDPAARAVTIRVLLRTEPMERFAVSREIRRRVLDAFEEAGIEVPPRSVITVAGGAAVPGKA